MRWVVVEIFEKSLAEVGNEFQKIAIVGGSSKDPEIEFLKKKFPNLDISYFGIDNYGLETNWSNLDLNYLTVQEKTYDLVVCSQVLEHVWNQSAAFTNLKTLVKEGGYVWINCPASNIAHGSPEYFSAGYSPEYLVKNLCAENFELIAAGAVGSKRYYFATHLLRLWATPLEHKSPIFGYRMSRPFTKGKLLEFLKRLPGRVMMAFWKPTLINKIEFATESYFLGRLKGHS